MNESQRKSSLDLLFRPRSVAVVGASRDATSMSGVLLRNITRSFRGPIYPVNPHAQEIIGWKTYPTVADVPEPIDLAFVAVPASKAVQVLQQCLDQSIKMIVMITAGFSETGAEGKKLEEALKMLLDTSSTRMIGPNCMGIMNTDESAPLNGSFGLIESAAGNVAIASQSGALGFVLPDYIRQWSLGVSKFASIGNKLDISENDLLAYWADDPTSEVIQLYLESFQDPKVFRERAVNVSRKKPIVALKAGRTETGSRAACSHTAALASRDTAVEALFSQTGVIRVNTLQELFEVTAVLASQPLPIGRRVAILSDAGGPAVLCADALEANGLHVPTLSLRLQQQLREFLRPETSVANPIDLIGTTDPQEYRRCLVHLLESDEVDTVIVIYVARLPETNDQFASVLHETAEKFFSPSPQPSGERRAGEEEESNCDNPLLSHPTHSTTLRKNANYRSTETPAKKKALLAVFMQTEGQPRGLTSDTYRIPSFMYPESAAQALTRAVEYAEWRQRGIGPVRSFDDIRLAEGHALIKSVIDLESPRGHWLKPGQVANLLRAFGLPYVETELIHSEEEAIEAFQRFKQVVALKVVAEEALHKSDVGGVVLNLHDRDAVRDAYRYLIGSIPQATGMLVQPMMVADYELMVGVIRDPQFGPLVAVGSGGTKVEWLDDIAFRLSPLSDFDIEAMIQGTKIGRMARHGFRKRKPGDLAAIHELLGRVSVLVESIHEVCELDFNPVMLLPAGEGAVIVDARIRVAKKIEIP